jgi:hypothetical protein
MACAQCYGYQKSFTIQIHSFLLLLLLLTTDEMEELIQRRATQITQRVEKEIQGQVSQMIALRASDIMAEVERKALEMARQRIETMDILPAVPEAKRQDMEHEEEEESDQYSIPSLASSVSSVSSSVSSHSNAPVASRSVQMVQCPLCPIKLQVRSMYFHVRSTHQKNFHYSTMEGVAIGYVSDRDPAADVAIAAAAVVAGGVSSSSVVAVPVPVKSRKSGRPSKPTPQYSPSFTEVKRKKRRKQDRSNTVTSSSSSSVKKVRIDGSGKLIKCVHCGVLVFSHCLQDHLIRTGHVQGPLPSPPPQQQHVQSGQDEGEGDLSTDEEVEMKAPGAQAPIPSPSIVDDVAVVAEN